MNVEDYCEKMKELLNEQTYEVLQKDLTNDIERKTAALIRKSDTAGDVTKRLISNASFPHRLYGLWRIYLETVLLRFIMNFCSSPAYLLAQHFPGLVGPFIGHMEYHIKTSVPIMQKL
jgi:hypothetical protein